MKRLVAFLLLALVGLPSAMLPAVKGNACSMPRAGRVESCSYCATTTTLPAAGPALNADCCRFLPKPEQVSEQAGSIVATPRPLRVLDVATSLPMIHGTYIPAAPAVRARVPRDLSPPNAPPTRTTHLLL